MLLRLKFDCNQQCLFLDSSTTSYYSRLRWNIHKSIRFEQRLCVQVNQLTFL